MTMRQQSARDCAIISIFNCSLFVRCFLVRIIGYLFIFVLRHRIVKICLVHLHQLHRSTSASVILEQRRLAGPFLPVKMGQRCLEYISSEKVLGINID